MIITINRTYEVEWFDNGWGETGWHLVKSYDTLKEAIDCAKETSKKYSTVRIMMIDTPIDNRLAQIYTPYRNWKD